MGRITVEVNEDWLGDAQAVLGTATKVATINAALHEVALRKQAVEIVAALDAHPVDLTGSERSWRYGGGRDFSTLLDEARSGDPG